MKTNTQKSIHYTKAKYLFLILSLCIYLPSIQAQKVVQYGSFTSLSFTPELSIDTSFNHVYLHKSAAIEIRNDDKSIIVRTLNHIRIKVLKESGLNASVIGIPFMSYNNLEEITSIKGLSYDGTSIIHLDTSTIKNIEINDKVSFKEFQLPGVKVGSILEYEYVNERRYIEELPEFYFQQEVPVLYAQLSLTDARYVRYDVKIRNEVVPITYKKVEVDTTTSLKLFTRRPIEPIITHYWIAEQIPAFDNEPFILQANDFRMHVTMNWSKFGVPLQVIEANWDLVSAELSKENGLEANISAAKKWFSKGKKLASEIGDKDVLLDSLFYLVRNTANFDGNKGLLSKTNPDELFTNPIQDAATINQALIAVLRGAGFKSYPLLSTTIHKTDLTSIYPTKYHFEKLLVYVEWKRKEQDYILLDASDAFAHVNMIPTEFLNQKGFLFKGFKSYEWINLINNASVFEQQLFIKGELQLDGTLKGTISGEARGYLAREIREKLAKSIDIRDHFRTLLFEYYFQIEIEEVNFKSNAADSITFEFNFTLPNAANVIDKGLVIKPLVIGNLKENPFKKEKRDLPIQFKAEEYLVVNAFIKVPKGYSSKSKPILLDFGFDGAFIKWNQFSGSNIDYQFKVRVQELDYKASSYPNLKKLYDLWQQLSFNEMIIFKP